MSYDLFFMLNQIIYIVFLYGLSAKETKVKQPYADWVHIILHLNYQSRMRFGQRIKRKLTLIEESGIRILESA